MSRAVFDNGGSDRNLGDRGSAGSDPSTIQQQSKRQSYVPQSYPGL